MNKKYILTGFISVLAVYATGQTKDTTSTKGITIAKEIEVVRPYKPVLADAVKIRRNPNMTDEVYKPALTYSILDKKLELNADLHQLEAQKLANAVPLILVNNYAKVGVGNFNTSLGELYIANGNDPALQTGVYLKHLSQGGNIDKQRFSNQQIGVFGRSVGEEVTLSGRVGFDRNSSYFYGFDPAFASIKPPVDKQRVSKLSFEGEVINNYTLDPTALNYVLKAGGYFLSNISQGRETSGMISGYLNKKLNKFNLGLAVSTDFTTTKDVNYTIGNHIARVNPYIKIKGQSFSLNIGLNVAQEFGSNSRLNVLPAVTAELPIAQGYATLIGGIVGDVQKTTLNSLYDENLYLSTNIAIHNSLEKMNIYVGVRGNGGSALGFKILVFTKTIENMPLFVNDSLHVSRFKVQYDSGKATVSGIDGELNIKASDVVTVTGRLQITDYKMHTEKEAWFKPAFKLSSNLRAQINNKIYLDGELAFNGETYAKTYTFTPLAVEGVTKIKSFMDISAGAEYRINTKIGVYLRANNLLGTGYQQYLYYPKLGLSVFGGLNYSF